MINQILLNIQFNFNSINDNSIIIAVVGYVIVFFSLVLLYFTFFNLPKLLRISFRRKSGTQSDMDTANKGDMEISGELNAAISVALYIYFSEVHDDDHAILTFKRRYKQYSPWSSKIYNVINFSR